MNLHPHAIEELDYEASRGDRLWTADPDVCCAAFQLGACPHTEAFDPEFDPALADLPPVAAPVATPALDIEEPF